MGSHRLCCPHSVNGFFSQLIMFTHDSMEFSNLTVQCSKGEPSNFAVINDLERKLGCVFFPAIRKKLVLVRVLQESKNSSSVCYLKPFLDSLKKSLSAAFCKFAIFTFSVSSTLACPLLDAIIDSNVFRSWTSYSDNFGISQHCPSIHLVRICISIHSNVFSDLCHFQGSEASELTAFLASIG